MKSISLGIALACTALAAADHSEVTFEFRMGDSANTAVAHARELFAEISGPHGRVLRIPAYYSEAGRWTVHARADQPGDYRLGRIIEIVEGREIGAVPTETSSRERRVTRPSTRPSVARVPEDPTRFVLSDGSPYTPLGANLAWTAGKRVTWHVDALEEFAAHGLNWTRIWMCHWGAMNLDWLPEDMGPSPAPGTLDERIARHWDDVLAAAERHGVYVQVVLQHHGQYATTVNPNWALNPWNAANPGGFLKTAGEFFTSRRAIELTKHKYRYIVARWSHSPAVMAWELFNEVHWTDAYRHDRDEAAVAAWHTEMADYIRSIDPYRHLVTTSLDDLRSPVYAAMDYYQPHLYAINMLTGVREFERPFGEFDRPIFFGEIGDDKLPVSPEEKAAGSALVPQVWAGLMGPGPIPAQSWLGESFLRTRRVGELGAIARFIQATGITTRAGLTPFSPPATSDATMPLRLIPGYDWATHRAASESIPLDGSDSLASNHLPGILVGHPLSIAEGYLAEFTLEVDIPRTTTATVAFADAGARGASVVILVDGHEVAAHRWSSLPGAKPHSPQPPGTPERPASISVPLPAGRRTITLRNTGGEDWIRLGHIDLGLETSVIAAAGKRSADFIALWVWNKRGVHAIAPTKPASATLHLADVAPGAWNITWWDADLGKPSRTIRVEHAGGTLRLETPPIARHAAVVLESPTDSRPPALPQPH